MIGLPHVCWSSVPTNEYLSLTCYYCRILRDYISHIITKLKSFQLWQSFPGWSTGQCSLMHWTAKQPRLVRATTPAKYCYRAIVTLIEHIMNMSTTTSREHKLHSLTPNALLVAENDPPTSALLSTPRKPTFLVRDVIQWGIARDLQRKTSMQTS